MNGVVGILEVDELPRAGGTTFAASGGQPLGDAVITKRAFVGDVFGGVEETAAVGASLNAIAASDAVVLIHENYAIRGVEGGSHRADLSARRIHTVVAEFGDKKVFSTGEFTGRKTLLAAIGRIHDGILDVKVGDVISLDPSAEITVRDIIFERASAHATSAADALGDVEEHPPPMLGGVVGGSGLWSSGEDAFPGSGRGRKQDQELATREVHLRAP